MRKSIKEKMKIERIKNAKTLVAVERERERENLFIQYGIRLLDYIVYCLLEDKKIKNVEIINNNIKFNKGRAMPIFNKGIGLSLFAFMQQKIVSQKLYYIYYIYIKGLEYKFLRLVRAGP